ncbi:DUF3387 domain-containing protein [Faecalibacterium sp. CLA-AA-H233]|uniref:DUF3387 domain-containing protein n=1 Tax=Faecalibacterium butyricigenerans TaxID=1851427 RepID=A0ABS8FD83_9FIRM|nr:DUF3387 domain-containing protein [Faecalibacterium sp. CLA-AA-H233]MCC2200028.1 DUF3387 domain-containing protein [Faecalibacterium sp. CLA-AA-H233]
MILNTEPIKRLMVLSSTTSARLWRKRSKRLSTPNLRLLAEQSERPQSVEAGDQDLPCKNGYPPQYSPEVFKKVMEQVENFEENN